MLTVRELWKRALPQGTELLAGGAGLDRRVDWAIALRTRPPAFDAVKGGELAIVTVRSIRVLDDRLDLAAVMQSLADRGGVAVAIIGDASADAITVADRMLMPLLRLPSSQSAAEVHHAAVRFIIDQRTHLSEREQELRNQLTELAMAGAGAAAITERLASLLDATAVWLDSAGELRHATGDQPLVASLTALLPALQRWSALQPLSAADPPVCTLDVATGTALSAPIPLRECIGGWVVVTSTSADQAFLRVGVASAASAIAIELARERAVLEVRDDLEGDLVSALVQGSYSSAAALDARAQRLGLDLAGDNAVIVIASPEGAMPSLLGVARKSLEAHLGRGLVGVHASTLCVVVPQAGAASEMGRLAEALLRDCITMGGGGLSAGVGRSGPGLGGVSGSHAQAQRAMSMGRQLFGPELAVQFSRLGVHRLLAVLADHPELAHFVDERLGELRRHDGRGGSDLVATLDAFLACHGSPTEAAHRLHLHRNTVLYRLRRIEDIAHVDLADPLIRLEFQLSLRGAEVLGPAS